jgi:hypothetical protein
MSLDDPLRADAHVLVEQPLELAQGDAELPGELIGPGSASGHQLSWPARAGRGAWRHWKRAGARGGSLDHRDALAIVVVGEHALPEAPTLVSKTSVTPSR